MLPSLFPEADSRPAAILALADGTIFRGVSIGAPGHCVAQLVVDTAMAGYQELLVSPAYGGQILALTYPHIGNIGISDGVANVAASPADGLSSNGAPDNGISADGLADVSAGGAAAATVAGLVVRDCPHHYFHFAATQSLPQYLAGQGVVAIADVDTRKLARILRQGAQQGCIYVGDDPLRALALLGVQPDPASNVPFAQTAENEQAAAVSGQIPPLHASTKSKK